MDIEKLDLEILKTILSNRKYGLTFLQDASEKVLHPDLWRFIKIVLEYTKIYKEAPTKKTLLDKAGKNENLLSYIEKIYEKLEPIQINEKEFGFNVDKLKNRYRRITINRLRDNLEKETDLTKNLANIQNTLNIVREVSSQKVYAQNTLKDSIGNFIERFKARKENPDLSKGVYTGFNTLDYITNGLKSPSYVLCCGSSGAGKSTLLMSMAVNMFMANNSIDNDKFFSEGNSVIYYSLEIPAEECIDKLISCISQVPLRNIETTNLSDEEKERIDKTLKFIKNYNREFIIVDIPKGATAQQLEAIYKDFSERKEDIKIVVCDYIGIMDCDDKDIDQDWLRQTAISEDLYKFARVNDLILLTGVQLNEQMPSKSDNQMGIFRLARARSIVNPSTLCMMIEKKIDENNYPTSTIHIVKSRRSALGQFTLRKSFNTCCFLNDTGLTEENKNIDDISKQLEDLDNSDSIL